MNVRSVRRMAERHEPQLVRLAAGKFDPRFVPMTLYYACVFGFAPLVRALLNYARADPTCDEGVLLWHACLSRSVDTVRVLLEDGRVHPDDTQADALYEAVRTQNADLVALLLEDGRADPSARKSEVLRVAVMLDDVVIARQLMQDGRVCCKDARAVELAQSMGLQNMKLMLVVEFGACA